MDIHKLVSGALTVHSKSSLTSFLTWTTKILVLDACVSWIRLFKYWINHILTSLKQPEKYNKSA